MGFSLPPTFSLLLLGTSLTAGRLCTPDLQWPNRLVNDMRISPECKGPILLLNGGVGSSTSAAGSAATPGGITQAAKFAPLRPSHVLMEDFGINDCVPANAISTGQQTANLDTIRASLIAENPAVRITHQTMSSVIVTDTNRLNLAAYYANGTAWATGHGYDTVDNFSHWPANVLANQTVDSDGLHPLWTAVFATFSYPYILTWARAAMAAYWP